MHTSVVRADDDWEARLDDPALPQHLLVVLMIAAQVRQCPCCQHLENFVVIGEEACQLLNSAVGHDRIAKAV